LSTRARYEVERILTQPDYMPTGYWPGIYRAATYGAASPHFAARYGPVYVPPAGPGYGYNSGYPQVASPNYGY